MQTISPSAMKPKRELLARAQQAQAVAPVAGGGGRRGQLRRGQLLDLRHDVALEIWRQLDAALIAQAGRSTCSSFLSLVIFFPYNNDNRWPRTAQAMQNSAGAAALYIQRLRIEHTGKLLLAAPDVCAHCV